LKNGDADSHPYQKETIMNKRALFTVLTLISLYGICEGQEKRTTPEDTQPGVVTSKSRGCSSR
jgi:hypothetical protein